MNVSNTHIGRLEQTGFVAQCVLAGVAIWMVISTVALWQPLPAPALAGDVLDASKIASAESDVSIGQLEGIWQRDLRQTLIEPKKKPKPKPKPPPPPPPVKLPKLIATFVEDGRAWGLFVDQKGGQRVRNTSGTIDGYRIIALSPGAATVERSGKQYEVRMAKKGKAPQGRRRRRGGR